MTKLPRERPRSGLLPILGLRSLNAAVMLWLSAADVLPGSCCVCSPVTKCRGKSVHVVQVDERVAPLGHADRNLTHIQENLLEHTPIRSEQVHAMPVESPDLETAAKQYATTLGEIAGSPPTLYLVHLGLGPMGILPPSCLAIRC